MSNKISFLIYAWGSTILFIILIMWLAAVPYLASQENSYEEVVKVLYRVSLYAVLLILIYRSLLASLRASVSRLSYWRSKDEKAEDSEFSFIIETLLLIIAILLALFVAIVDEYIQHFTVGRYAELKDILISFMAILLAAILIYSEPIIGELEIAIKDKFFTQIFKKRGIK